MDLKSRRFMYSEGVGFRYETGGMMEQLRVLSADRIRQFHKEMYQPRNLCLVLVGAVDHHNLLEILNEFEDTILSDVPKPYSPFKRPWTESKQASPLSKTVVETVEFPEEDETMGEVSTRHGNVPCFFFFRRDDSLSSRLTTLCYWVWILYQILSSSKPSPASKSEH